MIHDSPFVRHAQSGFGQTDPAVPDNPPAAGVPSATPPAAGDTLQSSNPAGDTLPKPAGMEPAGRTLAQATDQNEPLFTLPPLRALRDLACAAAANPPAPIPLGAGGALARLQAIRTDQVLRHGHTAQADDDLDLYDLARAADRPYARMRENASLHRMEATRQAALKLAALCLAIAESCDRRLAGLLTEGTENS